MGLNKTQTPNDFKMAESRPNRRKVQNLKRKRNW